MLLRRHLQINKGKLIIEDDYDIVGYSNLYMQDPKDYILVHGDFWMDSIQSHKENLTNGVFELKGDFKETGSQSDNFYASGNHKILLTGLYTQVIDIKNHNGCRVNILDYSKSKGTLIKTPVYVVNKIGKIVDVNVIELVNKLPEDNYSFMLGKL